MFGRNTRRGLRQDGVDHRKDGCVAADANGDQRNRCQAEQWGPSQNACSQTQVVNDLFQSRPAPNLARPLFHKLGVAEFAQYRASRLSGWLAALDAISNRHANVAFDLFVGFLFSGFGKTGVTFLRAFQIQAEQFRRGHILELNRVNAPGGLDGPPVRANRDSKQD